MSRRIIDSHIHVDLYNDYERKILQTSLEQNNIESLISVSYHYESAKKNLLIAEQDKRINVAIGYHPEQPLPEEDELIRITSLIEQNIDEFVAIGEIGLPYYKRRKNPSISLQPYIELLTYFLKYATLYNKPIVLHAIYDDASKICQLLEKHNVKKAQFHWFKGDVKTLEHLISNNYFISITPDVCYEAEIEQIVRRYPLELMMIETDGPWRFDGPFWKQMTHPKMLHSVVEKIAILKRMDKEEVYRTLYHNTKQFFKLPL